MLPRLVVILSLATLLTSCSKDTPTSPTPDTFTKVKTGSIFTYESFSTDSLGTPIAGPRDTSTSTVLQTDGVIGGKTGVIVVQNKRAGSIDTSYYANEMNNNVSLYGKSEFVSGARWSTFPFATGGATNSVGMDSTQSGGVITITRDSLLMSLIGSENISVQSKTIATKKGKLAMHVVTTNDGAVSMNMFVDNMFYYYAPSLGFIVKSTSPYLSDQMGNHQNGRTQILISYVAQ